MRYTAYTIDGSPIFRASSAQELADRVFTHMQESRRPHIGYTYDEWHQGNYTTWQLRDHLEGYPHKNFSEVADWWKGRHTSNVRVWRSGPPPSIGWWNASISKSPDVWRWWNGKFWSRPAYQEFSSEDAASLAEVLTNFVGIEWNDYWPENARVKPVRPT